MDTLIVKNFGPIQEANIEFGDLTLFVGPQASGKSIFLQLLKLIEDRDFIRNTLEEYNFVWNGAVGNIFDLYYGDGMDSLWDLHTEIVYDDTRIHIRYLFDKPLQKNNEELQSGQEHMFYIPAQRVLSVSDGRPKNFMEFDDSAPYVLKYFSEFLRRMLSFKGGDQEKQFPNPKKLKEPISSSIKESIYQEGEIFFDARRGQKKFSMQLSEMNLPFMTWSSGQKEFLPLLLSFYWLIDAKSLRDNIKYVVIEEPEMGLHPGAVKTVVLQVIDLLSHGYKVIVSTHSTVFLEFAWAFQFLKKSKAKEDAFLELFELKKTIQTKRLFENIMDKTINTYYFNREKDGVVVKNISSLDAGSENIAESEWGGLSTFVSRASEVVAKYIPL